MILRDTNAVTCPKRTRPTAPVRLLPEYLLMQCCDRWPINKKVMAAETTLFESLFFELVLIHLENFNKNQQTRGISTKQYFPRPRPKRVLSSEQSFGIKHVHFYRKTSSIRRTRTYNHNPHDFQKRARRRSPRIPH